VRCLDRYNLKLATPNEGYLIAAALLCEGVIATVVTLNFDLALSTAIGQLGGGKLVGIFGPAVRTSGTTISTLTGQSTVKTGFLIVEQTITAGAVQTVDEALADFSRVTGASNSTSVGEVSLGGCLLTQTLNSPGYFLSSQKASALQGFLSVFEQQILAPQLEIGAGCLGFADEVFLQAGRDAIAHLALPAIVSRVSDPRDQDCGLDRSRHPGKIIPKRKSIRRMQSLTIWNGPGRQDKQVLCD